MVKLHKICLGLLLLCPFAHAQTSLLNNSATVEMTCRISTTNMNFGAYNPLETSVLQASSAVQLTCTPGSVTLKLNGGTNSTLYTLAGDQYNYTRCQRAMKSARGDFVAYDLSWSVGSYNPATSNSSNPVVKDDTCSNTFAGTLGGVTFRPTQPELATRTIEVFGYIRNYPNDRTERSSSVDARKARPGSYTDSLVVQVTY